MHGILVLDKPAGVTSASAVDRVRRELGVSRAGHGGTLDPIATGVLPICLGAGTKLAQFLLAEDKAYIAQGMLGIETDTLDRTGRIIAERPVDVSRDALVAALAVRLGEQTQIPPMYSAIKQGGVRLYDLARAGEEVERTPRKIRIDELTLLAFEPPRFEIAIACSKGTYVRSVIADIGAALATAAHLTQLRRIRSGRFTIDQAVPFERLGDAVLIPPEQALDLERVVVPAPLISKVLSGAPLAPQTLGAQSKQFQLVDGLGRLLAVAHAEASRTVYDRVFPELVRLDLDRGSGRRGA